MGIATYGGRVPVATDQALAELCTAIHRAQELLTHVLERSAVLQEARASGRPYAEIVTETQRPLVVEMLTDVLEELSAAGSTFRRAEARALHADGLSQEAIASLFGVTRQRVSALLKRAAHDERPRR